MVVLREAARRLGRTQLAGLTLFTVREPCVMCVGALLESDADGLVFALADPSPGAAGSVLQLATADQLPPAARRVGDHAGRGRRAEAAPPRA
jgi:tRNA(adenine34) deaminase